MMIFAIKSDLLLLVPRDCNTDSVCSFDSLFLGYTNRFLTSKMRQLCAHQSR